jgi:hypothetical protein
MNNKHYFVKKKGALYHGMGVIPSRPNILNNHHLAWRNDRNSTVFHWECMVTVYLAVAAGTATVYI